MPSSNVRNIDSLAALQLGMVRLSKDWGNTLGEMKMAIQRAEEHFAQTVPAYWRHQCELASREIAEARDALSRKRSTVRAGERPPATEEFKRVQKAEERMRKCEAKLRQTRAVAIEVNLVCEKLRGPLADVDEHCETILPQAARELASLVEQLRAYAQEQEGN